MEVLHCDPGAKVWLDVWGQVAQKLVIFCVIYYNNVIWKKAEQYLVFSERELTVTFVVC